MGHGPKVTLVLVSIYLVQLSGTWGSEIDKHYYTSTFEALCYDTCETRGSYYYWCNTKVGWDYCSPLENMDYEGYRCSDEHPCGKYNEPYYWCRRMDGGWGYCGKVEHESRLHLSLTYHCVCIDACMYNPVRNYYWCYTEEGWDYCSPAADVTYRNEPCQSNHPCGNYGEKYTWCWTDSNWDYCGLIKQNECSYVTSSRKRRESNDLFLICTLTDKVNNRVIKFYAETNRGAITDRRVDQNEITELILRWNNGYLGYRARSGLITSDNLRIDLQGTFPRSNQRYCNLQIQINEQRQPGTSTTVAQVIVPQNEDIPDDYIRMAFEESIRRRAKITVTVSPGYCPARRDQTYG